MAAPGNTTSLYCRAVISHSWYLQIMRDNEFEDITGMSVSKNADRARDKQTIKNKRDRFAQAVLANGNSRFCIKKIYKTGR